MRVILILLLSALVVAGILLLTSVQEVNGSPSPKKRKGSSSSSSSSSSSASSPSRPSSSSSGGSKSKSRGSFFGGGKKYKPKDSKVSKKSFAKKHWKKALAFGAGAYVGYKVAKLIKKGFKPNLFSFGGRNYDFDEWDRYARIDGWVCRNDRDCTWMDPNLGCDDRKFAITLINAPWPWKTELRGRCACEDGYFFDNGSCESSNLGLAGLALWIIAVIVVAIIAGCCCCCCCVCYFMKR